MLVYQRVLEMSECHEKCPIAPLQWDSCHCQNSWPLRVYICIPPFISTSFTKKYHPKKWKSKYWIVFTIDYLLHQTPYFTIYPSIYYLFIHFCVFTSYIILPFSKLHPARGDPPIAFVSVCLATPKTKPVDFAARAGCTGRAADATDAWARWDPTGDGSGIPSDPTQASERSTGASEQQGFPGRALHSLWYIGEKILEICIYIYIYDVHACIRICNVDGSLIHVHKLQEDAKGMIL